MKYKKLLVFVTVMFLVTVSVICFSMLFKVVDVLVYSTTVVNSNEQVVEKTENTLKNYSGKNLVFINENEIKTEIEKQSPYIKVVSVEKSFPNKISVTIAERKECYYLYDGGYYYILDDEFFCVDKRETSDGNIVGAKNLNLVISVSDYSVNALQVGTQFNLNDSVTQNYLKTITPSIIEKSNVINSVTVKVKENSYFNRQLTIEMVEGVNIVIDKADERIVEKFNFAYDYYLNMPNKSYAVLTVTVSAETGELFIS